MPLAIVIEADEADGLGLEEIFGGSILGSEGGGCRAAFARHAAAKPTVGLDRAFNRTHRMLSIQLWRFGMFNAGDPGNYGTKTRIA